MKIPDCIPPNSTEVYVSSEEVWKGVEHLSPFSKDEQKMIDLIMNIKN